MARHPGAEPKTRAPMLQIRELVVHYGHAMALHGVDLTLEEGVFAVVGRNGMGKTTTCMAIAGLVRPTSGSIRFQGRELVGRAPNQISGMGVGYVPQGRRVWPSLSVDETLRLAARGGRDAAWTVERVYETFPRLAERKRSGGAQLSGGEQQMLAIGRALLSNPRLLVMDEPTEGLAPVIVEQVERMIHDLAAEGEIAVLLIEQNIGVALDIASRVGVMINGRIAREMPAAELKADTALQQRLLGVGRHDAGDLGGDGGEADTAIEAPPPAEERTRVFRVRRAEGPESLAAGSGAPATPAPTRWSQANPLARPPAPEPDPRDRWVDGGRNRLDQAPPEAPRLSAAEALDRAAYVVGTFDTKGTELGFLARALRQAGLRVVTVDLSTSGRPSTADVGPKEVAFHHPRGSQAVFSGDRGQSVAAMAEAFARFLPTRRDLGGVISAGGSGGTALATPAMQRLPVGLPKVMVSTVASGNVGRYVGPTDICMIYSVTDVQGINRISRQVLGNAAHALAGMIAGAGRDEPADEKPAIGLTMFGVTTPCVQAVAQALEGDFDCLVFHATGTGGQSMEKLADSGLLAGVLDITTTEVADLLVGGVFAATEDRFGAIARSRIPYVGSCGALDMVNFGAHDTVPERFRRRTLYEHNPQVTLMRTTAEENAELGRWIAERLNRCEGPLRFLIPEGGVSLLDAPGQAFWDPEADKALFQAIERGFRPSANRRLVRLPHNLNDPAFSRALVEAFREIAGPRGRARPDSARPTSARPASTRPATTTGS
ncbi:amino acid/amide ABC transporter ATP-binding protein 2, HAAT family [Tistlia consotensis]|uniref:UPF0261 protein SAMN05428998_1206 n=1 Tax=Tistlia consotensis USBA 355 TaxID=560819 RepID=A0A1Y6CGK1_9PROT|nr:ABC transporter permease [Tistlia consotensis]SMF54989.1 amino acid/amide ABC transporter ATP-binding protein 2, HAAT family [Tistlia consotensis USBA 355]SNR87486.1 amino acid/amide ABC transporter ATP-binding protein 2, HAAT family [Tistlia consotensis]